MSLALDDGPHEARVVDVQLDALGWDGDVRRGCPAVEHLGVADHTGEQTPLAVGDAHLYFVSV